MSIKDCLHPVTQLWVGLLHVRSYLLGEGKDHITGLFFPLLRRGGRGEMLFPTNKNSKNMLSLNTI